MSADLSGLSAYDLVLLLALYVWPLTVLILCWCVCLCYWCIRLCYWCIRDRWRREQPMTQPFVELPVIPMSQPGMVQQAQVVAKAV